MGLVACPFCREMFEEGEAKVCPICGVPLAAFDKLGRSPASVLDDDIPVEPEWEPFAFGYAGRGRGALLVASFVGLVLFFFPWVKMTLPYVVALSGFDLSRRLGWSWGAAVGWVVLVPVVLSRRSIAQLRGARVAASFLSSAPAVTVAVLYARPPRSGLIPVRFTFDWAFWASLACSVVAFVLSLRLGGRLDDIKVERGTSRGHATH